MNEAKGMTLEEVKGLHPCWLYDPEKAAKLDEIGNRKERWTAKDVLALPDEEVSIEDKFWVVLCPEFIDEPILNEFACRCAEEALKLIENPDPRSVAAIEAKRKWLRGEINDNELAAAWYAGRAARSAACAAASDAASDAGRAAGRAASRKNQMQMLRELMEA